MYTCILECWQVLKVIELLYQYVKMLRISGPQEWVFQELQAMGMMEFRFAEEESADQYVVRLACACPPLLTKVHLVSGLGWRSNFRVCLVNF